MIIQKGKISYDNRGSALIMALVVSAVLMVLSLSLLAVSYSLYLSQKNNTGGINEKEMFYSAIEIIEQELTEGRYKVFYTSDGSVVNQETIDANTNDPFGIQIVKSIYRYCESSNKENNELWKCFNLNTYNGIPEDKDKAEYIKSVSRYFKMKSYGAFNINIQMYWEVNQYETDSEGDLVAEYMKGIVLHVIYRLTNNNDDTLIKNERVYRLGVTVEEPDNVEDVNAEDGNTLEDINTEEKKYMVKFGVISNKEEYKVDPEFFPNLEVSTGDTKTAYPYIMVSKSEWGNNVFEKKEYRYIKFLTDWYTGSSLETAWSGKPKDLRSEPDPKEKDIPIARTNWGKKVPVRIKFIIHGYYIDLDIYKYCYLKYLYWNENTEGPKEQKFKEDIITATITDQVLEACNINISEMGNSKKIKWMLRDENGNYHEFFDKNGVPVINYINETQMLKTYSVYATFPSYYTDPSNLGTLDKTKIIEYDNDEEKKIKPPEVSYKEYSFERIIGQ